MDDPINGLVAAILLQMVTDWRHEERRPEIREFLASDCFDHMARALGLNPGVIRTRVETGRIDLAGLRSAFRRKECQ